MAFGMGPSGPWALVAVQHGDACHWSWEIFSYFFGNFLPFLFSVLSMTPIICTVGLLD